MTHAEPLRTQNSVSGPTGTVNKDGRERARGHLRVAVRPGQHRQVVGGREVRLGLLDLPVALSLPPLRSSVLKPHLAGGN